MFIQVYIHEIEHVDGKNDEPVLTLGYIVYTLLLDKPKCIKEPINGYACIYVCTYIVELRTPAMPVWVGGGKERAGFHLNLRT